MDKKLNVFAVAVAIAGWFALGAGSAVAADTITVHCVNALTMAADPRVSSCQDFHPTIQEGVDHADSGETVFVGKGTYDEQVTIIRPLTLEGAMGMTSIIQPSSVAFSTSNIVSGAAIAAILLADGTTGVDVSEFTIDGGVANACSTGGFVGIFYRASSGLIGSPTVGSGNHVMRISETCNTALGIFVQTDKGGKTKADVAILNNEVDTYGKNGITANQAGTFVTVSGNMVTGNSMFMAGACVPPKSNIVQNGVQIGFSARGRVEGNTISNHCYDPETFVACGALFFKAGSLGRAADNTFEFNEGNVCNVSGAVGSAHSPFNP